MYVCSAVYSFSLPGLMLAIVIGIVLGILIGLVLLGLVYVLRKT